MTTKHFLFGAAMALGLFALSSCEKEKEPSSMTITQINLVEYPDTDSSGSTWDLGSAPDVYIQILDLSGSVLYTAGSFYQDPNGTADLVFTPTSPINITCPTCDYTIRIYDHDDLDPDDLMLSAAFKPFEFGDNETNEESRTKFYSSSTASFTCDYTYSY